MEISAMDVITSFAGHRAIAASAPRQKITIRPYE